jgi:sarcosine oxidase subunit beta
MSQLPLAQRAHAIWGSLAERIGTDGEYLRSGHFKIARSEADLAALERYRDMARDFDLGIDILSGARLRERCPWLGGKAVGGSLCMEDGQANPRLVSPAFAQAARRAGAEIHERTRVEAIAHDGRLFHLRAASAASAANAEKARGAPDALGGLEEIAEIEVRAPVLLNCAGAWANAIAGQFGEAVPMRSGHPAMAVTEPVPFFMNWSLGVEGGGVYCRQVARGNLVLGGGPGRAIDADRARSDRGALAALSRQAIELLPVLRHAHFIRTWSGTEGYLPDREPVIGPSRTTPGLFHGFGFAGAGFQVGPAVGEVLAELVRDGRSSTPIEAFSIQRFVTAEAGEAAASALAH